MKINNIDKAKLGFFVIIALAIFIVTIYFVGSKKNLFSDTITISCNFKDVKGLQPGNNVRFSGIHVGTVNELLMLNDTTIKVSMDIKTEAAQFINLKATALISLDGLVGNKVINITPTSPFPKHVENGAVIYASESSDMNQLTDNLSTTSDDLALISANLVDITNKINAGDGNIATLINDDAIVQNFNAILNEMATVSDNLNQLSNKINQSADNVISGEGLIGYLLTDTLLENNINSFGDNLNGILSSQIATVANELESASSNINSTSELLKSNMQLLESSNSVYGTLVKDSLTADNLKSTLKNIEIGTVKFNESMEALKHNFLLRRYFKKKEKKARKDKLEKQKAAETNSSHTQSASSSK